MPKFQKPFILAIAAGSWMLLAFTGCATPSAERLACEQRDWYETGRRDGSQGSALDRLTKYKKECGGDFASTWETLYTNGRNAGLVEYCSPETSYELGRMGITYQYVCPSTMETAFLSGYQRGQSARKLEIENQKIDAEIDSLLSRLNREQSRHSRRELASELDQLRKLRSKNEKDLNKISN